MKEVLADYAVRALEWLESGVAFIQGEIPKYIEEILKWELAENIIIMAIMLFFGIIAGIVLKWCLKKGIAKAAKDDGSWYHCDGWIIGIVFSSLTIFGCLIALVCHIPEIVQIIVAPRVYLVEYLADFVSSN